MNNKLCHSITIRFRNNNEAEMSAYEYLISESEKKGISQNQVIVSVLNDSRKQNGDSTMFMSEQEISKLADKIFERIVSQCSIMIPEQSNAVEETEPVFINEDLKFCF